MEMEETSPVGRHAEGSPLSPVASSTFSCPLSHTLEINKPFDRKGRDRYGLTPLHACIRSASWRGEEEVLPLVRALLEGDAEVDVYSYSGKSVVKEAFDADCDKIVDVLVDAGVLKHEMEGEDELLQRWRQERAMDRKTWPRNVYIERTVAQLLWLDKKITMAAYMSAYAALCPGPGKNRDMRGTNLPASVHYRNIRRALMAYTAEILAALQAASEEEIAAFYNEEWKRFSEAARTLDNIFQNLNRHWVRRELCEGKPGVFRIGDLCFLRWTRDIVDKDVKIASAVLAKMTSDRAGIAITQEEMVSIGLVFVVTPGPEVSKVNFRSS